MANADCTTPASRAKYLKKLSSVKAMSPLSSGCSVEDCFCALAFASWNDRVAVEHLTRGWFAKEMVRLHACVDVRSYMPDWMLGYNAGAARYGAKMDDGLSSVEELWRLAQRNDMLASGLGE